MLDNWIPPETTEQQLLPHHQKTDLLDLPSVSLPPTPPNRSPNSSFEFGFMAPFLPPRAPTPPATSYSAAPSPPLLTSQTPTTSLSLSSSSSASSLSSFSISPPSTYNCDNKYRRRASDHPTTPASRVQKPSRRRASCHPSVASVVSLTAHEPVSNYINGIEHITFLYSHERMVKEYTVRADVTNVDLNAIPMVFKAQNTIYPRANVEKSKYDGNRWEYETTCNALGWKLCWLNQEQLCGRRGLIQRAVDSYRNRHTEMRSRRVTRQEKVANGTLRKRKSKKSILSPLRPDPFLPYPTLHFLHYLVYLLS
ncbi:unnamed protein product [Absidia cylindrospora]